MGEERGTAELALAHLHEIDPCGDARLDGGREVPREDRPIGDEREAGPRKGQNEARPSSGLDAVA